MNKSFYLLIIVAFISFSCQLNHSDSEKEISNADSEYTQQLPSHLASKRVQFVLALKDLVAQKVWPDFARKKEEGTLIYFGSNQSEIFFANRQVLESIPSKQPNKHMYYSAKRIDSIPFHMEVMISFNASDSNQYFYKNPIEQYSSVEEVGKYIPSVQSTEMWTTMVIHEMFHHYQYNTPAYVDYAQNVVGNLPFDSRNLVALCQEGSLFLPMIQKENELLMRAIDATKESKRDSLIQQYLTKRTKRINQFSQSYPHLEAVENYYITQEGSARYIEFHTMLLFNEFFQSNTGPELQSDPQFTHYTEFKNIDLGHNTFNYLVYAGPTDYHYTIGFNTMRLLDLLASDYKTTLLELPSKGLHQYLEDYLTSNKTHY